MNFRMANSGIYVNEKYYFEQAFKDNKVLFEKIQKIEKREKPKAFDTSDMPINTSRSKNTSHSTSRLDSSKLTNKGKYSSWLTNCSLAPTANSRIRSNISIRKLKGGGAQSQRTLHNKNSDWSNKEEQITKNQTSRYFKTRGRKISSANRTKILTTSETLSRRQSVNRFSKNSQYNSSYKITTSSHVEENAECSPKFSQEDADSANYDVLYLKRGLAYPITNEGYKKLREGKKSSLNKLFV